MHYARRMKLACLFVALLIFVGCKAKQDKPNAGPVASADKSATSTAAPVQNAPGAKTASPKDMTDARTAAQRVLAQMEAGDFASIYNGASSGFKLIGSESAFVTKFQQTRMKTGVLKNPKEISFETRPNSNHVTVYRVDNERFVTDIRLTFQRGKNGSMELAGLNQHDEPKK